MFTEKRGLSVPRVSSHKEDPRREGRDNGALLVQEFQPSALHDILCRALQCHVSVYKAGDARRPAPFDETLR